MAGAVISVGGVVADVVDSSAFSVVGSDRVAISSSQYRFLKNLTGSQTMPFAHWSVFFQDSTPARTRATSEGFTLAQALSAASLPTFLG